MYLNISCEAFTNVTVHNFSCSASSSDWETFSVRDVSARRAETRGSDRSAPASSGSLL